MTCARSMAHLNYIAGKYNRNMSNQQYANNKISRRQFVNYAGVAMALGMVELTAGPPYFKTNMDSFSKIRIKNAESNFEREPLHPYRFKGSAITEAWQVAARLRSESGISKTGLGTQNILWSDLNVFADHSEAGGNA